MVEILVAQSPVGKPAPPLPLVVEKEDSIASVPSSPARNQSSNFGSFSRQEVTTLILFISIISKAFGFRA